jgi:hypothetical protein
MLAGAGRSFTRVVREIGLKLAALGFYEILSLAAMVAVIVICLIKKSFFISGTVLGASAIAYLLAFFLASFGLKRQGTGMVRIFYAVAAAACARWHFEIVYHYTFPGTVHEVARNLAYLSTNISETNFPLIWAVMMVMIIFTGYKYMAAGRWFWTTLALSGVFLLFWIFIGYPQWVHPEKWPMWQPLIPLIPPEYTHAPNEAARGTIVTISLIVNSLAKIVICAWLPTLFLKPTGPMR